MTDERFSHIINIRVSDGLLAVFNGPTDNVRMLADARRLVEYLEYEGRITGMEPALSKKKNDGPIQSQ